MKGKHWTLAGTGAVGLAICAGMALYASPVTATAAAGEDDGARCSQLVGTEAGGARIDSATYVAAGTKIAPFNFPAKSGFCQVRASTSAAPTSKIRMEIWLPTQWNQKLLGLGGGGFNGGMASAAFSFFKPVSQGYVAIATDSGHDVADPPLWALNQPERIADYGYRANHLGAQAAKALAVRYYGTQAKRAYFHGCSNGGRDALMLAQRFPKDYDGIIVGAPANSFVSLMANFANYRRLMEKLPPNSLTPKMQLLHDAAVQKCDTLDGAKDGLIENPRACRFDPAVLSCKPGQDPKSCLSPDEVTTVRTVYRGSRTRDGRLIHPGLAVGSEYQWPAWVTNAKSAGGAFPPAFFGYFVYDNPNWTMASLNLDRDWAVALRKLGGVVDATDTDLRPFISNGGKLLMYHGWDDAAISPENTLSYYAAASRKLGKQARNTRLFMMPGVGHCFDGNGPSSADFVAEMDHWVDSGVAPEKIVAEKPENLLFALAGVPTKALISRPVCTWPKVAHYDGKGSMNLASSFTCR